VEIRPELHLKQTQKLIMTPQLQQAIKMLQLSNIDLSERIEKEIAENPRGRGKRERVRQGPRG
jgi:RNA polymerase sigma-54 factor